MTELKRIIEEFREQIVGHRRELHKIPETAYNEEKTGDYVARQLHDLGLEVQTGVARTGVVGLMSTGRPGKTVLLRADMDALPIKEETGLPFASEHEGNMHACGHDGHMAMVLGAALVLDKVKDKINGNVKFLFQPAEESPGGAKPMIDEGVMDNPVVNYALGAHLWPALPEGTVGIKAGPLMAAMDRFELTVHGKGGHGAMPHLCVDSIDVAIQVVNALQRVVSRQINPLNPTVLTIGSFNGGTAFNIIPDSVEITGTTRTFDRDIWESWPERMGTIIKGVCDAMGARHELRFTQGYPPTINDGEMAVRIGEIAADIVGKERVVEPEMTMGGEDMSFFLERSKGCFVFLGIGRESGFPLHNSRFDYREDVLLTGVELHCRTILDLLGPC